MTFLAAFTVTATVTPQTENAFGDRTPGTPATVDGCVVWQGSSSESTASGDTVTTDLTVLMPAGTVVRATDTVEISGIAYEVVGDPNVWSSPLTGLAPGVQVQLRTQKG